MMPVDNLAYYGAAGYLPEDINGDGLIDGSDMGIIDNNAGYALSVQAP